MLIKSLRMHSHADSRTRIFIKLSTYFGEVEFNFSANVLVANKMVESYCYGI